MTAVKLGDGAVVSLSDWVDDKLYGVVAVIERPRPPKTGDPTRWPDIASWRDNGSRVWRNGPEICDVVGLRDSDLVTVVTQAFDTYDYLDDRGARDQIPYDAVVEAEWVLANVLDAAVDEQRRRDGLPDRGPRPEPSPVEPFTVGVAQRVPL
jgi:hypothetical protein